MLRFILIAFLLPACASVKDRYRRQNTLIYQSARCTRASAFKIDYNGSTTALPPNNIENDFDLNGLDEQEVEETFCGPYCEPPGTHIKYEARTRWHDEMHLKDTNGLRIMRL